MADTQFRIGTSLAPMELWKGSNPFANKWLNPALAWELALLALIVNLPFLNALLGTFPLTLADWLIVASVALTISPVLEVAKWMARRAWIGSIGS